MTRPLPSFATLVKNYPNLDTAAEVFALIGGKVQANAQIFQNSCVVRMSRSLNYAGSPIEPGHGAAVVSGNDQKWYAYRVAEFLTYMIKEYGPPAVTARGAGGRPPTPKKSFTGRQGVIAFKGDRMVQREGPFRFVGQRSLHSPGIFRQGL